MIFHCIPPNPHSSQLAWYFLLFLVHFRSPFSPLSPGQKVHLQQVPADLQCNLPHMARRAPQWGATHGTCGGSTWRMSRSGSFSMGKWTNEQYFFWKLEWSLFFLKVPNFTKPCQMWRRMMCNYETLERHDVLYANSTVMWFNQMNCKNQENDTNTLGRQSS